MNRTTWKDSKFMRSGKYQLDRNENCDVHMRDFASDFMKSLNGGAIVQYPNIRKAYESVLALDLDPDSVLLTSGAEQAIRAVINVKKEPRSIAYPYPTYGMLPVFAEMYRLELIPAMYDSSFSVKIDDLLRGDIIYLANPDNPTGSVLSMDSIKRICDSGKTVILDEAYFGFSPVTCTELLRIYQNLYIVRSFSKAFGAAGIRLGMVISHKENIEKLNNEKPAYEINSIACEYLNYVASRQEDIKRSIDRIILGKKLIEKRLGSAGHKCRETFSNYVLVEFNPVLHKKISDIASVAVIEISSYKFIRITAPDEDTAREFLGCLGL